MSPVPTQGQRPKAQQSLLIWTAFGVTTAAWTIAAFIVFSTWLVAARDIRDSQRALDRGYRADLIVRTMPKRSDLAPSGDHALAIRVRLDDGTLRNARTVVADATLIPTSTVADSIIAIEDHTFYEHGGVGFRRLASCVIAMAIRTGRCGASTITQQVSRALVLGDLTQSWARKYRELGVALRLEDMFTKEELLRLYLNSIPAGYCPVDGARWIGLGVAARELFGKDLASLGLTEAATISALPRAPDEYVRQLYLGNPQPLMLRRNTVLDRLHTVYPTRYPREKVEAAKRAPLGIRQTHVHTEFDNDSSYLVDLAIRELKIKLPDLLASGNPLEITISGDTQLQLFAKNSVAEGLMRIGATSTAAGGLQAALISVDPRTGQILAAVGGSNYAGSSFNRVTARRQLGSIFKPVLYLAAFEESSERNDGDPLSPEMHLLDAPTTFRDGNRTWTPSNYGNHYLGWTTLRRALEVSSNVIAVSVGEYAGFQVVVDFWKALVPGSAARPYPSIALGTIEASSYEVAEAFTVFANGGEVIPLTLVEGVWISGEQVALPASARRRVATPENAYQVTDMMRGVLTKGTAEALGWSRLPYDVAGKTGTTSDTRDAWFVGFTPDLLTVVWVGHDNNRPVGLTGGAAAGPIWSLFMKTALKGRTPIRFVRPQTAPSALSAENARP